MSGYCVTGSTQTAMKPAIVITMDSTAAKIGRSMKKRENTATPHSGRMRSPSQAGHEGRSVTLIVGEAGGERGLTEAGDRVVVGEGVDGLVARQAAPEARAHSLACLALDQVGQQVAQAALHIGFRQEDVGQPVHPASPSGP